MATPDGSQSASSGPADGVADSEKENRDQPCSTCRELILRGAKKCIECDSYQDWRKHLTGSTAVLTLGLSLLVGITAACPILYRALRAPDSELSISSVGTIQFGHIYVLLGNAGKMPGAVGVMTIELPIEGDRRKIWLHPNLNNPNAIVIPADNARSVDFAADFTHRGDGAPEGWDPSTLTAGALDALRQRMEDIEKGDGRPKCAVVVDVASFKGKPDKLRKELDCRRLKDLVRIYWGQAQLRRPD